VLELLTQTTTLPGAGTTVPGDGASGTGLLGPNFLEFLILALGAALVVGNLGAVLRPRTPREGEGELRQAPVARSLVMAAIGAIAAAWALASIVR
jgi:hypothetical protein